MESEVIITAAMEAKVNITAVMESWDSNTQCFPFFSISIPLRHDVDGIFHCNGDGKLSKNGKFRYHPNGDGNAHYHCA